jgi:hypothetical protein
MATEPAFIALHFRAIDVEIANRISLEFLLRRLIAFNILPS